MNTIETEVVPPSEVIALNLPADDLPPSLLQNIEESFTQFFAEAEKWRKQALEIRITDASQTTEMKLARTIRLALRQVRVAAEKKRKELKEDALRMGKAIDGANNMLLAAIEPLERHCKEQEEFAERLAEEQRQKLITERREALQPFLQPGHPLPALDSMDEAQFTKFLDDMRMLHDAREREAKRIEAERVAREAAEAAEKERLRQEAEKLAREKAEAEEKAKAAEKAREEAELRLAEERAAAEAAAIKEREAAERAHREAAEKARKESEALEAKAKAEREAAEREVQRLKDEAARKEREIAEQKAEQAKAAAKAAQAPDKQKLLAIAADVRKITLPAVKTQAANTVLANIQAKREAFAKWIEEQAAGL